MSESFESLGVAKWLCEALDVMAIRKPTAVQSACIPAILQGRDCIGGAKTGSGKTIAFAAPMLTQWSRDPYGIFGLILTPTRELALQIAEQFTALGATMNIRVAVIVGGVDMVAQAIELQRRPHFVIATPGRLADHIRSSGEETVGPLKRIRYLVLDEADRLLSNSFAAHLGTCFGHLPPARDRQTLLFTATVTDAVAALKTAERGSNRLPPFVHETSALDSVAIPSQLSSYYIFLPQHVKEPYLHAILTHSDNEKKSCIVFVNRTRTAELLRRLLRRLDVRVTSLHSGLPQSERINSLQRFKAEAARVLVCTDVASRGLDIPTVELVVNYDLPADPDDYIHRVGRTARAGRRGESLAFVAEKDVERVLSIEKRIGTKLVQYEKVTDNQIIRDHLKPVSAAKRESLMEMEKEGFGEIEKIRKAKAGVGQEGKVGKPKPKTRGKSKAKNGK